MTDESGNLMLLLKIWKKLICRETTRCTGTTSTDNIGRKKKEKKFLWNVTRKNRKKKKIKNMYVTDSPFFTFRG